MRLFAEPSGPMFLQCFRGSLTIICNYFRWSPTNSLAMRCIVQIYSQLFKQKKLFSCQTQESGSLNLQWASAGGKSRKQPKTDSCPFHFLRFWLFCQQYRWQVGPTNIWHWQILPLFLQSDRGVFLHFLTLLLHVYLNMILSLFRGEQE